MRAAAVPLVLAAGLAWGSRRPVRLRLRALARHSSTASRPRTSAGPRSTVLSPRVAVAAAALGAAAVGGALAGPVAVFVAGTYTVAGGSAWHRRRRTRAAERALAACADALGGFADDLRAGQIPVVALRALLADLAGTANGSFGAVDRALDGGGDVVAALRSVRGPLTGVADRLATVWGLTGSGVPLADLADRLDDELRGRRRARARADAQSAAARTTAWLVAGLPVLGLLLGQALGAEPARMLTQTPVGAACAVAAVLLHLGGFAWAGRIADTGRRAR